MRKHTFLLCLVFLFKVFVLPVAAQEETSLQPGSVALQESLVEEIKAVNASYRGQLETYRQLDKEFRIAIDQYQTHQTLVSIENAVKATKRAMQSRNEVLTSYLTLLKLELLEAKGIEISQKNITLARIEEHLAELAVQKVFIDSISERIQVNEAHTTFSEFGKSVKNVSEEAQVLLAVGKLQSAYDKSLVLREDISQLVDPEAEIDNRAAKTRALNEINQVLDASLTGLQNSWGDIASYREKQTVYSMYNNLSRSLNPIYVNLSQSVSYFNEFLSL